MADNLHHELLKHCTGRVDVAATRTPDPQGLPRRTCLWLSWAAFQAALESLRRSLPVYGRHTEIRTIASRSTRACPPRAAPAWWNSCRRDREPRALAADRTGEAGGLVPPGSRRSSADAVTKAKHAQFVGDSLRAPMGKMADIRDHHDGRGIRLPTLRANGTGIQKAKVPLQSVHIAPSEHALLHEISA